MASLEDLAIIEAIQPLIELARNERAISDYERQSGRWLQRERVDLWGKAKPIQAAIDAHPVFGVCRNIFFGDKQIWPVQMQATGLLFRAVEVGAIEAVAWLHRVYGTQETTLRFCAEVFGIWLTKPIQLSNGVTICPISELPESANQKALAARYEISPRRGPDFDDPVVAYIEIPNVPGIHDHEEASRYRPFVSKVAEFRETILALTLLDDAAPAIGISWTDFVDPDLSESDMARMHMTSQVEGKKVAGIARKLEEADLSPFLAYLALDEKVRRRMRIALERLNLARRRSTPGNQAIDGSICLECLLGDRDSKTEMTYKIRLRAALLLGTDMSTRKEIKKAVGDFYNLRSMTVHGSEKHEADPVTARKRTATNYQIATKGLDVCARLLKKLVELKHLPAMEELELGDKFHAAPPEDD